MNRGAKTRKTLGLVTSVLLASLCFACSEPASAPDAATTSLGEGAAAADATQAARAFAETWDAVIEQGDPAAAAALFTTDSVHLAPDTPITRGRKAIEADFTRLFSGFTVDSNNPIDEIVVVNGWAWVRGTYDDVRTSKETGESMADPGKWLSILRQTEDGWRYAVDSFNQNAPSEPGAPLESVELPREEGVTAGPADDVAEIRALVSLWADSSRQQDGSIFADSFTEDGLRMNDDAPTDEGREAILQGWQAGFIEGATADPVLTLDVIEAEGDWAWVRGHWGETRTLPDGSVEHSMGKYIDVCRRTPDGWKIYVSLWNYDAPPPAPPV